MPFHFCADELMAIMAAMPFLGAAWVAAKRLLSRARSPAVEPCSECAERERERKHVDNNRKPWCPFPPCQCDGGCRACRGEEV